MAAIDSVPDSLVAPADRLGAELAYRPADPARDAGRDPARLPPDAVATVRPGLIVHSTCLRPQAQPMPWLGPPRLGPPCLG